MTITEKISIIGNVAIALSFVVALVLGIVQVRAAARDRKERLTLETLRHYQTREFAELMHKIHGYNMPVTYEEWQKLPIDDHIMFVQFTQQMETLGILVAEKFINIDLVDKILGSFVTDSWKKFELVVLDIRQRQIDPFLGEYFQWLAERLEEHMDKNSRKLFGQRTAFLINKKYK